MAAPTPYIDGLHAALYALVWLAGALTVLAIPAALALLAYTQRTKLNRWATSRRLLKAAHRSGRY